MAHIGSALIGVFVGLILAAYMQGRLDDRHVRNGIMIHNDKLYRIVPSEPR